MPRNCSACEGNACRSELHKCTYNLTDPYRILDPVTNSPLIRWSLLHSGVPVRAQFAENVRSRLILGFAIRVPEKPVPVGGDGEHLIF
ncbi:hypothetical protein SCLCIDRAFT_258794 [Scleroderma citrinum Foug A]|uniref:Uncharacterized protein n=1 Tax=Scleroderma citrinum Foug A TaxID=1036808 RepID=A0A0C3EEY3_9AGAM|nr:hypothetical protein SCLCIDRAFT_258794 [Scleroderma citrinum Foug A]